MIVFLATEYFECVHDSPDNERITVRWSCTADRTCPSLYDEYHPNFERDYFEETDNNPEYNEGMGISFTVEIAKLSDFDLLAPRKSRFSRSSSNSLEDADKPVQLATTRLSRPESKEKSTARERILIEAVAGRTVHVMSIRHLAAGAVADDKTLYKGISRGSHRLDSKNAKERWLPYLAERGIDEHFMNFILAMSNEKETREYGMWLEDILTFVEEGEIDDEEN
jgi:hypothetical protein